MGFLKNLICGKDTENVEDEKENHTRIDKYCREKQVRKDAELLTPLWNQWPDRNKEEVNRTTHSTGFKIPVYEIQVNYNDGTTETLEHESFTSPDAEKIEKIERVDVNVTSFRYSESKDDLKTGSVMTETLAAFNRDNINSVKIRGKRERVVQLKYELVETEIIEKRGSLLKREKMPHMYDRQYRSYTPWRDEAEFEWEYPENERQLKLKLVDEKGVDRLLEDQRTTHFKAENVELAQNE